MSFSVPTATIPELTNPTPYLSQISLADKVPYWITELGKTVWMELTAIKQLMDTGGGGTLPGTTSGTKHLYIVPDAHAGNASYVYATAAGQDFNLTLEGRPMIKGEEFEVLSAGGFKLINGDILQPGQRYELDLFQLSGSAPTGTATAGLFTGAVTLQTNTFLDSNYFNKLLQIRGGGSKVKVTLPAIEDTPENQVIFLEMAINNTKHAEVATKNGQNIYMNGTSYKSIFLGFGEDAALYRGVDGWYLFSGSVAQAYRQIGEIAPAYKAGINQTVCDGTQRSRADYARLWQWVQSTGQSLISEAERAAWYDKQGCFTTGDGSTTFNLPDLQDMFIRGLSSSSDRPYNYAGGRQEDQNKAHSHGIAFEINGTDGVANGEHIDDTDGPFREEDNSPGINSTAIQPSGGSEARPVNIGMYWVIKF